jgi:hypothetical protein
MLEEPVHALDGDVLMLQCMNCGERVDGVILFHRSLPGPPPPDPGGRARTTVYEPARLAPARMSVDAQTE